MSGSSNEAMEDAVPEQEADDYDDDLILCSADLPRPGFISGEIYALEMFVCKKLNEMDRVKGMSSAEKKKKIKEIAEDEDFGNALGASFKCSFSTFVEGRVFVDPLDITQHDGYELTLSGRTQRVTIENVREYVRLCKRWILNDGVLAQAACFRAGIGDFFDAKSISLLTPSEFRVDCCGNDSVQDWDEATIRGLFKLEGSQEAMLAVAAVGGDGGSSLSRRFSNESPTFGFLVKFLKEAEVLVRRQFLSFTTSLPIVTPGAIEVAPIVSSQGEFLVVR